MPATDALWIEFFAMGSQCSLWLYADDDDKARQAAEAAIDEVRRIERAYSRYLTDSLLSEINRVAMAGGDISVDPETALLIDHALWAHALSDGLFDVTSGRMREIWSDEIKSVPHASEIASRLACVGLEKVAWRRPRLSFSVPGMELDLGGIAKEHAADRAAIICASAGSRHGLINLGGDISIIGPHPDGSPWRVGICDPFGGGEAVATLFVAEGGVATSGDYERYFEVEGRRTILRGRGTPVQPSHRSKNGLAGRRPTLGHSGGSVLPVSGNGFDDRDPEGRGWPAMAARNRRSSSLCRGDRRTRRVDPNGRTSEDYRAAVPPLRNCVINWDMPWMKFCRETVPEPLGSSA
jgi:thiamine biosynthesis lipoprotein